MTSEASSSATGDPTVEVAFSRIHQCQRDADPAVYDSFATQGSKPLAPDVILEGVIVPRDEGSPTRKDDSLERIDGFLSMITLFYQHKGYKDMVREYVAANQLSRASLIYTCIVGFSWLDKMRTFASIWAGAPDTSQLDIQLKTAYGIAWTYAPPNIHMAVAEFCNILVYMEASGNLPYLIGQWGALDPQKHVKLIAVMRMAGFIITELRTALQLTFEAAGPFEFLQEATHDGSNDTTTYTSIKESLKHQLFENDNYKPIVYPPEGMVFQGSIEEHDIVPYEDAKKIAKQANEFGGPYRGGVSSGVDDPFDAMTTTTPSKPPRKRETPGSADSRTKTVERKDAASKRPTSAPLPRFSSVGYGSRVHEYLESAVKSSDSNVPRVFKSLDDVSEMEYYASQIHAVLLYQGYVPLKAEYRVANRPFDYNPEEYDGDNGAETSSTLNELRGTIDMIAINRFGEISLVEFKTTLEYHSSVLYQHEVLQLMIYYCLLSRSILRDSLRAPEDNYTFGNQKLRKALMPTELTIAKFSRALQKVSIIRIPFDNDFLQANLAAVPDTDLWRDEADLLRRLDYASFVAAFVIASPTAMFTLMNKGTIADLTKFVKVQRKMLQPTQEDTTAKNVAFITMENAIEPYQLEPVLFVDGHIEALRLLLGRVLKIVQGKFTPVMRLPVALSVDEIRRMTAFLEKIVGPVRIDSAIGNTTLDVRACVEYNNSPIASVPFLWIRKGRPIKGLVV